MNPGARVTIADGLYSGTLVVAAGDVCVVELDGQFDELPTDACWRATSGRVQWPASVGELAPAEPWQCATCVETRLTERDPARPTHCRWCPELFYTRTTTARQHIVTAYNDGREGSRRFYRRDVAGVKAASRRIRQLRAEGYARTDREPAERTR